MDVMIVEDEIIIRLATAQMVERPGHQALARTQRAEDALERPSRSRPTSSPSATSSTASPEASPPSSSRPRPVEHG
jgi:hypothetical protein